jgi:hypothetical protein
MKDFFISYNRHDRTIAEWIAWILEESGATVVIQAWDFGSGSNFVLEMQKAAAEAERTIAVLSENSLKSGFVQAEWAAAFAQDPMGKARSLIPIRVGPCKLTGLWAQIVYIDLLKHPGTTLTAETDVELLDETEAKQRILDGVAKGRKKPLSKPAFPQKSSPQPSQSKPVFPQKQISSARQQRLEKQQETLQQEWSLRQEKLNALCQAEVIETSVTVKFQLTQQIRSEETAIAQLEKQLETLERELLPPVESTPRNQQNVSSGQGIQINDSTAPVILSGEGTTINFHYGKPSE